MATFPLAGVEQFTFLGAGTVTSGGTTAPTAGTSQSWTVDVTVAFPLASSSATPPSGFYVWDPAETSEWMLVTVAPGGTGSAQSWTVTRGINGTTVAHTAGFTIEQVLTPYSLETFQPPWFSVVTQFGADPTGVNASDTAFTAAIAARPSDGCLIVVQPGTYSITSGVTWNVGVSEVSGLWFLPGVVINYSGSTTAFRIYGTESDDAIFSNFRIYGYGIIDGTSAVAGSSAMEIGDLFRLYIEDIDVRNFTGTGSKGMWINNTVAWTEQAKIRAYAQNCTTHFQFDVNGGTPSFERGDFDLFVNQSTATYNGVVLNNGATMLSGALKVRGNFASSNTALTSAVLTLTGDDDGTYSSITSCHLDVGVECGGTDTYGPYTIYFGSADNQVSQCDGNINFLPATTAFTNSNNTSSWGIFDGNVLGDPNLIFTGFVNPTVVSAGLALGEYATGVTLSSNGTITTTNVAYAPVVTTGEVTGVIMQPGDYDGQVVGVLNQGSTGGTITFAAAATSNVANGTAEVIGPNQTRLYVYSNNESAWYSAAASQLYGGAAFPAVRTPGTASITSQIFGAGTTGQLSQINADGLTGLLPLDQSAATAAVVVSDTATETSLGQLVVPPNDPVAGARYAFTIPGTITTSSTAANNAGTILTRWGGVTGTTIMTLAIGVSTPAMGTSLAGAPFLIQGEVDFRTGTTCVGWQSFTWLNGTTGTLAANWNNGLTVAAIPATVTATTTGTLTVDWKWAHAETTNVLTAVTSTFDRLA